MWFCNLGLRKCRPRYRKGKLWCRVCGCRRICRPGYCTRRVCKKVKCPRKICRPVIRYRIVKYKYYLPYYRGYGPRWVWKTKRVSYKVVVCKTIITLCPKCYTQRYVCGKICKTVCLPPKVGDQCIYLFICLLNSLARVEVQTNSKWQRIRTTPAITAALFTKKLR